MTTLLGGGNIFFHRSTMREGYRRERWGDEIFFLLLLFFFFFWLGGRGGGCEKKHGWEGGMRYSRRASWVKGKGMVEGDMGEWRVGKGVAPLLHT
jgi:hypothetical protein